MRGKEGRPIRYDGEPKADAGELCADVSNPDNL